jgi:hypothetical protein
MVKDKYLDIPEVGEVGTGVWEEPAFLVDRSRSVSCVFFRKIYM